MKTLHILTIGRRGADIVLDDEHQEISRIHAELTITAGGRFYLVDCGSSNGTRVKRHNQWQDLKQEYVERDDELQFGTHYTIIMQKLLEKR